jgi:hypothetical protein
MNKSLKRLVIRHDPSNDSPIGAGLIPHLWGRPYHTFTNHFNGLQKTINEHSKRNTLNSLHHMGSMM